MPDFAASLLNSSSQYDIVLDTLGTSLIITDHSNYPQSDEAGNEQADFTLTRIFQITNGFGNIYTINSLSTGDASCSPGNSGSNSVTYPRDSTTDQIYTIRLITLPTWNSGDTYLLSKNQYVARSVSGTAKVFKLIVTSSLNEAPESNASKWTEVTDLSSINVKYNVVGYAPVMLQIWEAFGKNTLAASRKTFGKGAHEWPSIEEWVKKTTLEEAIKAVSVLGAQGKWEEAKWTIAEALKIVDQ